MIAFQASRVLSNAGPLESFSTTTSHGHILGGGVTMWTMSPRTLLPGISHDTPLNDVWVEDKTNGAVSSAAEACGLSLSELLCLKMELHTIWHFTRLYNSYFPSGIATSRLAISSSTYLWKDIPYFGSN